MRKWSVFIMLTKNKYEFGLAIAEQMKYNINYDKQPLFDVICAWLTSYILSSEYSEDLTEEQRETLIRL